MAGSVTGTSNLIDELTYTYGRMIYRTSASEKTAIGLVSPFQQIHHDSHDLFLHNHDYVSVRPVWSSLWFLMYHLLGFQWLPIGSCNLLPIVLAHLFIYLWRHVILAMVGDLVHVLRLRHVVGTLLAILALLQLSTHQPPHETTSVPRGVTSYRPSRWPALDRHVLAIINFQDLADLSARLEFTPDNVDFLDAECRTHLGAIEEISLFTWCRHFDHREISYVSIRNLLGWAASFVATLDSLTLV